MQFGGDEVVKAKDGAGSATLSMAYAGYRYLSLTPIQHRANNSKASQRRSSEVLTARRASLSQLLSTFQAFQVARPLLRRLAVTSSPFLSSLA